MDSTDCAASVATKRQRVVQPMPGAGGGARTSDELSADDLAKLAECDDIGLDLTHVALSVNLPLSYAAHKVLR
jgi:hypothetical protein